MTSRGYPLNLILDDRLCLVVGGGAEAASRAGNLLEAGARVLVIGQEASTGLELLASPRLRVEQRALRESDLDEAWLVVQVSTAAALARQRVNDDPQRTSAARTRPPTGPQRLFRWRRAPRPHRFRDCYIPRRSCTAGGCVAESR